MSERPSMPWRAAGVSVPGARHVQDGVVCQDAVLTRVEEDLAIVAVRGCQEHTVTVSSGLKVGRRPGDDALAVQGQAPIQQTRMASTQRRRSQGRSLQKQKSN